MSTPGPVWVDTLIGMLIAAVPEVADGWCSTGRPSGRPQMSRTSRLRAGTRRRAIMRTAIAALLAASALASAESVSVASTTDQASAPLGSDARVQTPPTERERRVTTAAQMSTRLSRSVTADDLVTLEAPDGAVVVVERAALTAGTVGFDSSGAFFETTGAAPSKGGGRTSTVAAPEAGAMAAAVAPYRVSVGDGCVNLTYGDDTMLRCWKKWQVKEDGSNTYNYYVLEMQGYVQGPSHTTAAIKSSNQSTPGIAWSSPSFRPGGDSSGGCSTPPGISSFTAFGITFGLDLQRCETWDMNYSALPGTYRLTWMKGILSPTSQNRELSFTVHVRVPQSLTGAPGPIWNLQSDIDCSHDATLCPYA